MPYKNRKVDVKPEEQRIIVNNTQEKEWVTIGWIKPVTDKDGNVNEKVFRVEINGIIGIEQVNRMLDGEIKAIPIKTTQNKYNPEA